MSVRTSELRGKEGTVRRKSPNGLNDVGVNSQSPKDTWRKDYIAVGGNTIHR